MAKAGCRDLFFAPGLSLGLVNKEKNKVLTVNFGKVLQLSTLFFLISFV